MARVGQLRRSADVPAPLPVRDSEAPLKSALDDYARGLRRQYERVIAAMSIAHGEALVAWWNQASDCVAYLQGHGKDHKEFFDLVWRFDWRQHEAAVPAFTQFIVHLVSAHGHKFINRVCRALVSAFKPPMNVPEDEIPDEVTYDTALIDRIADVLHGAIMKILAVLPGAYEPLAVALCDLFPHPSHALPVQRSYASHCLRVLHYCPLLRESVLAAYLERVLRIDVEVKWDELAELEDSMPDECEEGLFGCDLDESPEKLLLIAEWKEQALKLDVLIDLLLRHVGNRLGAERDEYFAILLRVFDAYVLSTHKCKYTQFILFFIAQQHPLTNGYVDGAPATCAVEALRIAARPITFVSHLCHHLTQTVPSTFPPSTPQKRLTSVAYISSFLARSTTIPSPLVHETLAQLCQWLVHYVDAHEHKATFMANIDVDRHGLFYAVVQAVLYAVIFKQALWTGADASLSRPASSNNPDRLLAGEQQSNTAAQDLSGALMERLPLQAIIESSLNPLLMIQPNVSREFTRLALKLGLPIGAVCTRVLSRNRFLVPPTRTHDGSANVLDSYFPFDPNFLQCSSHHFKDLYQQWLSPDDDEDDDEEDDEDAKSGSTGGVPIQRRRVSSAMEMARSLEDGGFSVSFSSVGDEHYGFSLEAHGAHTGSPAWATK